MKILVVDDKEENRYLLSTLLTGNGFVTATATNGKEALRLLRSGRVDLIISDILMPVMDGFQLCRECKEDEDLKDIPFIFYTAAYKDEQDEKLAMEVGGDKFIRKPTDPDVLLKIIRGVIRDAAEGKLKPKKPLLEKEEEIFKLYSERLVAKLQQYLESLEEEITERKRVEERIVHLNAVLRAIRNVNQLIVKEKGRDRLLKVACKNLVETRDYHNAWIALLDESGKLVTTAEAGLGKKFLRLQERWKAGELPHCARAALDKAGISVIEDPPTICEDCPLAGAYVGRWALTCRLESGGNIYGLLTVSVTPDYAADEEGQSLFGEVAGDIGFALHSMELERERKQAVERWQQGLVGIIRAMAMTLEARDPYTTGHQRRVTALACAIAQEVGLSEEEIDGLRMTATIHDLGKIHVPAEILSKPGKLTDTEFDLLKAHPRVGCDILKGIKFPWPIAQIVLQHHERVNGSGYPQGLSGKDILLEARILAVADVVEAMSSHRPYRPALGIDKALEEIEKKKGTLYDPKVADACLKLFAEDRFKFED